MSLYLIANGPAPTTAAQLAVSGGTNIKTLLQLKPFNTVKIKEWGISLDTPASASVVQVELLETGNVFATVTASADVDVAKYEGNDQAVASIAGLTLSTTGTGYTATAEGSITTTRQFDPQILIPPFVYVKQFPLGGEPKCFIGNATRIRVKMSVTCNAICYILIDM